MRQAEAAAERVAELVMQADRDAAHDDAAHPGADQRIAARREVARVACRRGSAAASCDASCANRSTTGIAVGRVQALGGMGDRVDRADDGDADGRPSDSSGS
jgi:hypothetical protein